MKNVRSLIVLALISMLFAFPGLIQASQADKVHKLKMADSFPIGHPVNKMAKYFIEKVANFSEGKIEIEYYPAQQLGKLKDMLKLCRGGMTDIAYVAPTFFAGQLPLQTVMVLPFWTTATEGTRLYNALMNDSPELLGELTKYKVKPLIIVTTSQYDVGTVKKPVTKPQDLKGLRLKSSGGIFERIAARYGIAPVTIASPEVYEATQRGIVDGNIFSLPSVKGYRVNELEKYHTLGLRMGGFPGMYIINSKRFQKLPPDLQQALKDAASDTANWFGLFWDKMVAGLAKKFEAQGMKIYRVKGEDRAMWDGPIKEIEEEWITDMEKRKAPGRIVFQKLMEKVKAIVKE